MVDGWPGSSCVCMMRLPPSMDPSAQEAFCDCLLKVSTFGIRDRGKEAPIRPRLKSVLSLLPPSLSHHTTYSCPSAVPYINLVASFVLSLVHPLHLFFFFAILLITSSPTHYFKQPYLQCLLRLSRIILVASLSTVFTTGHGAVGRRAGSFSPVSGIRGCC